VYSRAISNQSWMYPRTTVSTYRDIRLARPGRRHSILPRLLSSTMSNACQWMRKRAAGREMSRGVSPRREFVGCLIERWTLTWMSDQANAEQGYQVADPITAALGRAGPLGLGLSLAP
jgi:hypothetical protein